MAESSSQNASAAPTAPALQEAERPAKLSADALDSLRMRVATMIDTELCSSKAA